MLVLEGGEVNIDAAGYVPLAQRMQKLREATANLPQPVQSAA